MCETCKFEFKLVPVIKTSEWKDSSVPGCQERTHEVLHFDMYVDGAWHGSRRTEDQAEQYRLYLTRKCARDA